MHYVRYIVFFFFNDTATTEIYTLSLHDALPILGTTLDFPEQVQFLGVHLLSRIEVARDPGQGAFDAEHHRDAVLQICRDRKSTRLNSSHANISYAVFCLKKKKR